MPAVAGSGRADDRPSACGGRGRTETAMRTPAAEKAAPTHRAAWKPPVKMAGEVYAPGRANTDASTATPNTPPSSRRALLAPEATPISGPGTEVMTSVATVGNTRPIPTPATVSAGPRTA